MIEAPEWKKSRELPDTLADEREDVIRIFAAMLEMPSLDGSAKRRAGKKPSWRFDDDHAAAAERHRSKRRGGELYDADSGANHRIHEAWRLLAEAFREGPVAGVSGEQWYRDYVDRVSLEKDCC